MHKLIIAALLIAVPAVSIGQEVVANRAPIVELVFPRPELLYFPLQGGTYVRLKASASDTDGSVAYVQFFAGTNLLGIAFKSPYNLVAIVPRADEIDSETTLRAIAFDDLGARTESAPVRFHVVTGPQPRPLLKLTSPTANQVFMAPATFGFSVERLVSADAIEDPIIRSRVDFYIGTNLLKRIETEPYSVTVTNLPVGEYTLRAQYFGAYSGFCNCPEPIKIQVAKTGFQSSVLTPDGRFRVSAFKTEFGHETVIEASSNLFQWSPILTNLPTLRSFHFQDNTTNNLSRFYRLLSRPP